MSEAVAAPGYWELLRRRPAYRSVWLASVVSLAGDWFTLIALYSLLEAYTGSGAAVGLMLLARFLPAALFSPLAGVIADRLSRGRVMIVADLLRAIVVLGFLFVRSERDVWLVYTLTFAQLSLSAFFDPAEQAAIGSLVEPSEVVTANTLQGVTWSAMLGLGAVVGGLVTHFVGREASFVVDALSYVLSAVLISRAAIVPVERAPAAKTWSGLLGLDDLREGVAYVRTRPGLVRALWVKTGWAVTGGAAILLYAMFGERVFATEIGPDLAVGVLLGMRGVGALIGPLVARRFGGDSKAFLERAITWSFAIISLFWLGFALAPSLPLAAVLLACAHTGVSTQWVFSTTLITQQTEPQVRGRVFSIDFMAYLIVLGASSWLGGIALDGFHFSPRTLMVCVAVGLIGSALVWLSLKPREEQTNSSTTLA